MQRTIQAVYDDDRGALVPVGELLDQPEKAFHELRRETTHRHGKNEDDRFFCPKCSGAVWPSAQENRFFKHYAPANPECEWYTGDPQRLDEINQERFRFHGEGKLHKRLVARLHEVIETDERFEWAHRDKRYIFGAFPEDRRKPDIWAKFGDDEIVFELQLARTYLTDIVGRDDFYLRQRKFIAWVFHNFDEFKEYSAAKDIYYANHTNALEIDPASLEASGKVSRVHLRANWFGFYPNSAGAFIHGWHSK
ncbi:MAG: DUF6035 family protein, partial [Cyclobacteriaceae bacterium]